jgi:cardiolipin synthase
VVYAPRMNDTNRSEPHPHLDPNPRPEPNPGPELNPSPQPHPPVPGPPMREGSPPRAEEGPVVHTAQPGLPRAGEDPVVHTPPTGPPRSGQRVSTAIRTVPNAVTLARLLLMPVCAYLLASGQYGWGIVLTAVVGSTDWVDGWLARRTGQVSRLGQLLDPLADRLLIASVAIALVVRGVVPWQAAVLLVARDLVLLCGWPVLKRRGIEPPEVIFLGKAATLVLLFALPVLTLGATGLAVADAARVVGLLLLWAGVVMYYLAGAVYVRMVLERLGHRAGAGS